MKDIDSNCPTCGEIMVKQKIEKLQHNAEWKTGYFAYNCYQCPYEVIEPWQERWKEANEVKDEKINKPRIRNEMDND